MFWIEILFYVLALILYAQRYIKEKDKKLKKNNLEILMALVFLITIRFVVPLLMKG